MLPHWKEWSQLKTIMIHYIRIYFQQEYIYKNTMPLLMCTRGDNVMAIQHVYILQTTVQHVLSLLKCLRGSSLNQALWASN